MVEELWVETEYEWSSFIQRKYIMENHYEVASIRNQFGNWVVVNVGCSFIFTNFSHFGGKSEENPCLTYHSNHFSIDLQTNPSITLWPL